MKKALSFLTAAGVAVSALASVYAQEGPITIISREDGSGTRTAFVEIVGVVDENGDDMTTLDASIQNQTSGVIQAVSNDPSGIGYISLGSLDESVKALKVDGVEATAENINAGDYAIARPFNVAWGEELSATAEDFLSFIHSKQGQTLVEEEGFIAVAPSKEGEEDKVEEGASVIDSLEEYTPGEGLEETLEVVGSTSVAPIMERLAEEYKALTGVTVNIQATGSSAGIQAAQEGTADLGMASRALTEEEAETLNYDRIAMDGIAVVVNNENELEDISIENVRKIFLGEILNWEDVK